MKNKDKLLSLFNEHLIEIVDNANGFVQDISFIDKYIPCMCEYCLFDKDNCNANCNPAIKVWLDMDYIKQ